MPTKSGEPGTKKSDFNDISGGPDNDSLLTVEQRTTAAVAKRLSEVHPNAKKKVRPTAQFVSNGMQEYEVYLNAPYWEIKPYKGGQLPAVLSGKYQTERLAQSDLIDYLKRTDRRGKAIWPGK